MNGDAKKIAMKSSFRLIAAIIVLALPSSVRSEQMDPREQAAISDFTRPWSTRKGISSIDRNAVVTLARVPLKRLSDVLATKAIKTHRNVMGSKIKLSDGFVFAFQLVGHSWSIMIEGGDASKVPSSAQLSKQLGQPVITLIMSDTSSIISYSLSEGGEDVEFFSGGGEEHDSGESSEGLQRYVLSPYPNSKQVAYFSSRRRQVTAKDIGNIWDFAERFMQESGAYDPGIDIDYLVGKPLRKRGREYRIQNPGFTLVLGSADQRKVKSVPELVGVDYFRF
jgi:hypothetical protein